MRRPRQHRLESRFRSCRVNIISKGLVNVWSYKVSEVPRRKLSNAYALTNVRFTYKMASPRLTVRVTVFMTDGALEGAGVAMAFQTPRRLLDA